MPGKIIGLEDGTKQWRDKKLAIHREGDLPAMELPDGSEHWCLNGDFHREGGPARVWPSGTMEWYKNGLLHREDGPAIEYADGTKAWAIDGSLHREGGPAIEYADGSKEYWICGVQYQEDQKTVIQSSELSRYEIRIGDGRLKLPSGHAMAVLNCQMAPTQQP